MQTLAQKVTRSSMKNYVTVDEVRQNNKYSYDYEYTKVFAYSVCLDYCKENDKLYEDAIELIDLYRNKINFYLQKNTSVYYYKYKELLYDLDSYFDEIDKLIDVIDMLTRNITLSFRYITLNYYDFYEAYNVVYAVKETKKYVKQKYNKKTKIKSSVAKEILEMMYYFVQNARFDIVYFTLLVLIDIEKIMHNINKTQKTS